MVKISPSLLAADFSKLGLELERLEKAGADYVHIDVMDGHFVNNITIGVPVIESLRRVSGLIFDVHLMISRPERYIGDFARAGADIITVHAESTDDPRAVIKQIRDAGKKAGISIKPATPARSVYGLLGDCDLVLVMLVEPGFGGQSLIEEAVPKITELRSRLDAQGLPAELEVDGGVNLSNVARVVAAGARVIVAGSAVFRSADAVEAVRALRAAAERGLRE